MNFWSQWKQILSFFYEKIQHEYSPFLTSLPHLEEHQMFELIRHVYHEDPDFESECIRMFENAKLICHFCQRSELHLLDLLMALYPVYPEFVQEWRLSCSQQKLVGYKHWQDMQREENQYCQKTYPRLFDVSPRENTVFHPQKIRTVSLVVTTEGQGQGQEQEQEQNLVQMFSQQAIEDYSSFDHQDFLFHHTSKFQQIQVPPEKRDHFLCLVNLTEREDEIVSGKDTLEIQLQDFLKMKRPRGRLSNSERQQRLQIEQKIYASRLKRYQKMTEAQSSGHLVSFYRESMLCPRPIYISWFQSIPFQVMDILCQQAPLFKQKHQYQTQHEFERISQFCQFSNADLCSKYFFFLSNKIYGLLHHLQEEINQTLLLSKPKEQEQEQDSEQKLKEKHILSFLSTQSLDPGVSEMINKTNLFWGVVQKK